MFEWHFLINCKLIKELSKKWLACMQVPSQVQEQPSLLGLAGAPMDIYCPSACLRSLAQSLCCQSLPGAHGQSPGCTSARPATSGHTVSTRLNRQPLQRAVDTSRCTLLSICQRAGWSHAWFQRWLWVNPTDFAQHEGGQNHTCCQSRRK